MEEQKFQSGAQLDTRTVEEKLKDFTLAEIVASLNPVVWVEKQPAFWRKFPIFNQDGSGSCVAQTITKMMGVLYWLTNGTYVHFSATHLYQRRINKPLSGMGAVDAFGIAAKGVTLEDLVPSQNLNDTQMDGIAIPEYKQKVGEIFKSPNYIALPIKDIDAIASVIQTTNKAVMVWFYFDNGGEWTDVPVILNPTLDLYAPATARHSVTAVDFTLYQGKKALIIEDSWGTSFGKAGQRIITEDFFKVRNFYAGYLINFVFEEGTNPPHHTFTKILKFGDTDQDVVSLQDVLKFEGLFPSNVASSGYYGAVTAKAVLAFQRKHQVAPESELAPLQGKLVGNKTLAKLNQLYGQ